LHKHNGQKYDGHEYHAISGLNILFVHPDVDCSGVAFFWLHELRAALCGPPLFGVLVSVTIFNVYGFLSLGLSLIFRNKLIEGACESLTIRHHFVECAVLGDAAVDHKVDMVYFGQEMKGMRNKYPRSAGTAM